MSGIYIPNFEPSKEGYISAIYPDGTVVKPKSKEPFYEIYKAIPVPDHGDLMDRDALPENRMVFDRVKFINERFIKDAPVIIPADTSEEYEDKDGYRDERNN